MEHIGTINVKLLCPQTSIKNYKHTLPNSLDERRAQITAAKEEISKLRLHLTIFYEALYYERRNVTRPLSTSPYLLSSQYDICRDVQIEQTKIEGEQLNP